MSEQQLDDSVQTQQPSNSKQPADDEPFFPDLKPGDAWGESITKKRAAELEAILQVWEAEKEHGERRGPFHRTALSGADVFWLAPRAVVDLRKMQADAASDEEISGAIINAMKELSANPLHLEGANLSKAHLEGAILIATRLEGANLSEAHLARAVLNQAHMEGAILSDTHLEGAFLRKAHLEGAILGGAHLERATLEEARLDGASLGYAYLEGASLREAHLEGAFLAGAQLEHAILALAYLDSSTALKDVILGNEKAGYVTLADVRWGEVNLAVVEWTRTTRGFLRLHNRTEAVTLGDERDARKPTTWRDDAKSMDEWISGYKDAVRANRQLATALRQQGLNEDADRFAYKAQKLQRQVLRRQGRYGAAFGSWLLDVVAGYGYKPMRTLTAYLLAIITFAAAYFALGQTVGPHLSPLGAFVFSMTSFHGRGFFPGGIVLDDPITVLAAIEAFIGLVIEVSFIATFTQRFFAR